MKHSVMATGLREMASQDRTSMFRLRYDTFKVRLGWDVMTTDDGQEIDQFDDDRAVYIIAQSPQTGVDACWRLLPTQGPNMLRDVFPELLHGAPAPCAADMWEMSRFAIATDRLSASEDAGNPQVGFGDLSVALMTQAWHFAKANGIARYVTVTTAAIERMLKKLGLHVHRLGPPVRIGLVLTVACIIEVDDITARALNL